MATLTSKCASVRPSGRGRTVNCETGEIVVSLFDFVILFVGLSAVVGCWSSAFIRRIIYKLLHVCFEFHSFCSLWEGWALVNRFNHTGGMTVITQTNPPKSVSNRCVMKVFSGVFCVLMLLFGFPVDAGDFVIWLSQISSFFFSKGCWLLFQAMGDNITTQNI